MAAEALRDYLRALRAIYEQRRAARERRTHPLFVVMPEVSFVIDDDWGLPDGYEWAEPAQYEPSPIEISNTYDGTRMILNPDGTLAYLEVDTDE